MQRTDEGVVVQPKIQYSHPELPLPADSGVLFVSSNSGIFPQTSTNFMLKTFQRGMNGLASNGDGVREATTSCVAEVACGAVGVGIAAPCGLAPAIVTGILSGTVGAMLAPAISTQFHSRSLEQKRVGEGIKMTRDHF